MGGLLKVISIFALICTIETNQIERKLLEEFKKQTRQFVGAKLIVHVADVFAVREIPQTSSETGHRKPIEVHCYLINNNGTEQEREIPDGNHTLYTKRRVKIEGTENLIGTLTIPLSNASTIGPIEFNQRLILRDYMNDTVNISFSSTKVKAPPLSKMDVDMGISITNEEKNYLVDFVVGEGSELILATNRNRSTNLDLIWLLRSFGDLAQTLRANDNGIELVQQNEKYIIKNFPMMVRFEEGVMSSVHGAYQNLTADEINSLENNCQISLTSDQPVVN